MIAMDMLSLDLENKPANPYRYTPRTTGMDSWKPEKFREKTTGTGRYINLF